MFEKKKCKNRKIEIYEEGDSAMLQRNYQQIADKFGFTKRQAALAIDALKELGVIRKDFRNLKISGMCVNNVLFIWNTLSQ